MPELSGAFGAGPSERNDPLPGPPLDGEVAERRQWATSVQSGATRAAVLGINDSLVTNISLILGIVGATDTPSVVQLAGLASLVAGACSMAVGEYVSMRAQVELLERLLVEEREAIRTNPEREQALLQDTLQRHGFNEATARGNQRALSRSRAGARCLFPGSPRRESGGARLALDIRGFVSADVRLRRTGAATAVVHHGRL